MARLAIRMPKMSMTMTEGEVSEWHAKVGDEVAVGDVVCEVMTDKVDMEVESTVAGTLVEIVVESGMAEVGAPIAWVEGEDDGGGFGDLLLEPEPEPELAASVEVEEPAEPSVEAVGATPEPSSTTEPVRPTGPTPAIPRARGLAREHGIDLEAISGSGPDGLVTVSDVEAKLTPVTPAAPVVTAAPAVASAPAAEPVSADRRAAVRAIVARTMEPSALIPQFTVWRDLELDTADAHRNGVSWNTLLLSSYAKALREVPELLSRWEDGRPVDSGPPAVAVAVATGRGLLVPVMAEPDAMTPTELDAELKAVIAEAQRGKIAPGHLAIANGSLSNLGGMGVDRFQALLTPPQASVLSVGSIKQRPVAVPGGVGLALTVTVGLTIDHRVADGMHGARLLDILARRLVEG
ncbi:MAG: dihydrolipoamide acetyltransferase family protein [Nocardioides sp.]|uniref:dihydrolipoamide acetyltransferase family protein n=1 Tax=Nocardioides sp. TaxID=35761 RepID=UPI0039E26B66